MEGDSSSKELTLDHDWHRFTVPVCLSALLDLLHIRWIVDKLPVEGARVVLSSELVPANRNKFTHWPPFLAIRLNLCREF